MPIPTHLLEAALDYARRGWRVFPCAELDKRPRIASKDGGRGCLNATTDAVQIIDCWTRFPNANIGLALDEGYFVLDVDTGKGGGESLAKLIESYGPLPETLRQRTPSGGWHYHFKSPAGVFVKNSAGFMPGLDTRAKGGYVVVEPSAIESGDYRWENTGTPLAEAPEWLLALVQDTRESFSSPERSDTGSRDVDDAALAGYLLNGGLSKGEIFSALWSRNNDPNRRDVPLSEAEVWKTVRSIARREVHTPESLKQAAYVGFDLDNLLSIRRTEIPPIEYLIDGLIVKSAVGMIAGKFASGKSMVILDMADAIAHGKEWCGLKTKRAHVLYLDRENPVQFIAHRLQQMDIADDGNLRILSTWKPDASVPGSFDIELNSLALTQYAEKHPGCLIIVDSLVGYLPAGASENDATEIRAFMNLARKLASLGATVIFLHHTGKGESSKEYRGSSDIAGSIDFGFVVDPAKNAATGALTSVTLNLLKQRTLQSGGLTFDFDGFEFTKSASRLQPVKSDRDVMIEILEAEPDGMTAGDFELAAKVRGITREQARQFKDAAARRGDLAITPGKRRALLLRWIGSAAVQKMMREEEAA